MKVLLNTNEFRTGRKTSLSRTSLEDGQTDLVGPE